MDETAEMKRRMERVLETNPHMIYPEMELRVLPPTSMYQHTYEPGRIYMRTFVQDKGTGRLVLVSLDYQYTDNVWRNLEEVKARFKDDCEKTQQFYSFNEETSIKKTEDVREN